MEGANREGGVDFDCELSITSWKDGIFITVLFFWDDDSVLCTLSSSSMSVSGSWFGSNEACEFEVRGFGLGFCCLTSKD